MLKFSNKETDNQSILYPYLEKHLYVHLIKVIPQWLPANYITFISALAVFISFVTASLFGSSHIIAYFAVPTLMLVYLVSDDLDGIQARKTNTSSPLGEYLDHFLDVFNIGLCQVALLMMLGIYTGWITAMFLFAAYLVISATFFLQAKTDELVLEKIGIFESLLLGFFIMILARIEVVSVFYNLPILGGSLTVIEGFILFVWGGVLGYYFLKKVIVGWRHMTLLFGLFTAGNFLIFLVSLQLLSQTMVTAAMLLYNGNYIGKIISARVTRCTDEIFPPIIMPAFFISFSFLDNNLFITYLPLVLLIQGATIAFVFVRTIFNLRHHWNWVNPKVGVKIR